MTDKQINKTIAEACEWKPFPRTDAFLKTLEKWEGAK